MPSSLSLCPVLASLLCPHMGSHSILPAILLLPFYGSRHDMATQFICSSVPAYPPSALPPASFTCTPSHCPLPHTLPLHPASHLPSASGPCLCLLAFHQEERLPTCTPWAGGGRDLLGGPCLSWRRGLGGFSFGDLPVPCCATRMPFPISLAALFACTLTHYTHTTCLFFFFSAFLTLLPSPN